MAESAFERALQNSTSGFNTLLGSIQQQIGRIDRNKEMKQQLQNQKELTLYGAEVAFDAELKRLTDSSYQDAQLKIEQGKTQRTLEYQEDLGDIQTQDAIDLWKATRGVEAANDTLANLGKLKSEQFKNSFEINEALNDRWFKLNKEVIESGSSAVPRALNWQQTENGNIVTVIPIKGMDGTPQNVVWTFEQAVEYYKPITLKHTIQKSLSDKINRSDVADIGTYRDRIVSVNESGVPVSKVVSSLVYGKNNLRELYQQVENASSVEELDNLKTQIESITLNTGSQEEISKLNKADQKSFTVFKNIQSKLEAISTIEIEEARKTYGVGTQWVADRVMDMFSPKTVKSILSIDQITDNLSNRINQAKAQIENLKLDRKSGVTENEIRAAEELSVLLKDLQELKNNSKELNPELKNVPFSDLYFNPYAESGPDVLVTKERLNALITKNKKQSTPEETDSNLVIDFIDYQNNSIINNQKK